MGWALTAGFTIAFSSNAGRSVAVQSCNLQCITRHGIWVQDQAPQDRVERCYGKRSPWVRQEGFMPIALLPCARALRASDW